jgi:protein-tyrosine phosphatase
VQPMGIKFDGLANSRDVGGLPTADGTRIAPGVLLRSDNLQTLTDSDVQRLAELGLTDVVDLRSDYEAEREGPGPLTAADVAVHHFSLFREWRPGTGEEKPDVRTEVMPEEALPWVDLKPQEELRNEAASFYFAYVMDRPDSIIAALRVIADAPGTVLVHCAAGKDRTGTVIALALTLAGVERAEVVADYAASSERVEQVVARLMQSSTYADNLRGRPMESHLSLPETMNAFLDHVESTFGSVEAMLGQQGWTPDDTARLRAKLRE